MFQPHSGGALGRGIGKVQVFPMDKPLNGLDCYTGVKGSIPFLPLLLIIKKTNNYEKYKGKSKEMV